MGGPGGGSERVACVWTALFWAGTARFPDLSRVLRLHARPTASSAKMQNHKCGACRPDLPVLFRDERCEPHGRRPPFLEEGKHMIRICLLTVFALASLVSERAFAQGQEVTPIKVNLPPSPSFAASNIPTQYPTGELSVLGLRKMKDKYMDKDVRVKAYLTEIYECPPELRKCNDELSEKTKKAKKKAMKKGGEALTENVAPERGGCRPCDQPHFFMADTPNAKKERSLLVADYPVKDWDTGDPKPTRGKSRRAVHRHGNILHQFDDGFRGLERPHHSQEVRGSQRQGPGRGQRGPSARGADHPA